MNFNHVQVFDSAGNVTREYRLEPGKTGYEYEFLACRKALSEGWTEFREMPHRATLTLMRQYDELLKSWNINPCANPDDAAAM